MTVHNNTDLLDLALADRPPETRAKVLQMCLKAGVSPEDEFWLILIALKSLELLILETPEQWERTFTTFTGDLNTWSQQNLSLLERKAKISALHSRTTQHQTQLLSELVTILMQQSSIWQTAAHASTDWQSRFDILVAKQGEQMSQLERTLTHVLTQVESIKLSKWTWVDRLIRRVIDSLGLTAVSFLVVFGTIGLIAITIDSLPEHREILPAPPLTDIPGSSQPSLPDSVERSLTYNLSPLI